MTEYEITEHEITLMALSVLIETLEAEKRENTHSNILETRLKVAKQARQRLATEQPT